VLAEDKSEPKLAVANEVKPDLVRVELEVSVEVVSKILIDVGGISCAAASADAVALAMVNDEVSNASNATALELAAERE